LELGANRPLFKIPTLPFTETEDDFGCVACILLEIDAEFVVIG